MGALMRSLNWSKTLVGPVRHSPIRNETGQVADIEPNNIDFSEFLEGIADICRIRAEQKGIELIYETLAPIPKAIREDEKWLQQVLINLLGNAVRFTAKGAITFNVGYQQEKFCFQVEDTGIGIAHEQLEEIFLPFQQVGEKSRETERTGLGWTISRIVKRTVQLEELDKQWVPFATYLRQLAKDFKEKQIREFLKQY